MQTSIIMQGSKRRRISFMAVLVFVALSLSLISTRAVAQVKNIVLVHGAFADGSGFEPLYKLLIAKGYHVSVVGNPNTGIAEDVAATQRVIEQQDGPCILVGHSYGGAIITEAGLSPKVVGLVYLAALAPDEGETLGALLGSAPHDPVNGILPPDNNGYVWYDVKKFHAGFCADIPKEQADFMAMSQVPVAASGFGYVFKVPAWKTKSTWYVVATEDHSIPPSLERTMGKKTGGKIIEIKSSHVVFLSHAKEVADIIDTAAKNSGKK